MADPKQLPPEVVAALKRGDKLGALKLMLPQAKAGGTVQKTILQALEQATEAGQANIKVRTHVKLPPEVVNALKRGDKIEAIKMLRAARGIGLAEAKGAIEAHGTEPSEVQMATDHPTDESVDHIPRSPSAAAHPRLKPAGYVRREGLSPGEVPRTNNALQVVMVFLAIMLAIGVYLFLA
jgi:ribosomal protein L7/L12